MQISRECFIIIYVLVLGHPNFRSFSHSSQNANVSFNRQVEKSVFRFPNFSFSENFQRNGLFILVNSLGILTAPHRTAPGPATLPSAAGGGAGCGGAGGGLGRADQNNLQLHHVNRFIAKCSINWSATINKLYVCRYLISTPIQKKQVKQTVNISNSEMQ